MKWLVCGGRTFSNLDICRGDRSHPLWKQKFREYRHVMDNLERLAMERSKFYVPDDNWLPSDIKIIAGGAKGVDTTAIEWAVVNWCEWEEYKADWAKYKSAAGPIRNKQMLAAKPDLVVAFPGGRGTHHMIDIARKAGVEVVIVPY